MDATFSACLTQALVAEDKHLLENALKVTDLTAITKTVESLPSALALSLLDNLCNSISISPYRLYSREGWINAILSTHSKYLASDPKGRELLNKLRQTLLNRLSSTECLLRLKGRVDTIVLQSNVHRNNRTLIDKDNEEAFKPHLTYKEGTSGE
ncbi:hypothetical protein BMR1_02g00437 [Babesia microti strain RI]|uniref:Small-subunit processome Utp12 domain-containing protein n=1 Tax=Babesia microti (strain RI) TaxID=1133968 RepID=A0A1R4A9W4_BABMR|nr:hypothetical protein BMR1_02g00437 [Babesia microti strain RI]SJK85801.1 hypothetical protein BMR1_02g00437 [Babesia microti strain RI]|eukprot:XP_021338022.1 hypothetical protein BMR1_02g00437 [Babesia microti strain RI]